MTLAAQTGLRGGDIAKLKRADIDWRANEVRVTQSKTGKPITLPLEPEAGNAIADWLLTCRQPDDGPYLFTVCLGPPRLLSPRGVSGVVARRMRQAGISAAIPRRGAHSFRRGLGTRMLEAEIPIDMLSQVLGHARTDSARPYLAASPTGLKDCALTLASVTGKEDRP